MDYWTGRGWDECRKEQVKDPCVVCNKTFTVSDPNKRDRVPGSKSGGDSAGMARGKLRED